MEGVIAIMMVFGMPVAIVFIVSHYRFRQKQIAAEERRAAGEAGKLLHAATEEKKQLEARIQNLESIVCSVDFELNQRLSRLAADQSKAQRAQLAAGATALAPGHTLAAGDAPDPGYRLGQLTPGQTVLARYTIEREIGRGGMGAVYLARDSKLGERVALKTISSLFAGDPEETVDRLRREVQAARRVTHGNVIRIHDLHEDGPTLFLSMEYVEGETLAARVKRDGPPAVVDTVEILGLIANGMAAAHAAGVVHRDLKPHNVLIGKGPGPRVVKVIDFGLARTAQAAGMTATGIILGTPEYMAPEQVRGNRCDARTDVYALGATAYFTLAGHPPFRADTPIAVGFAQVNDPPRPLRELRPEIPVPLERIVLQALAKDPGQRFADASIFARALSGR